MGTSHSACRSAFGWEFNSLVVPDTGPAAPGIVFALQDDGIFEPLKEPNLDPPPCALEVPPTCPPPGPRPPPPCFYTVPGPLRMKLHAPWPGFSSMETGRGFR